MNTMHWAYWVMLLLIVGSLLSLAWAGVSFMVQVFQHRRKRIVAYVHHRRVVKVRADLKGRHRSHCLCYSCEHFTTCPIAKATFDNCVKYGTVTPMWECPEYSNND